VAHDGDDTGVNELLRHQRALFRVGLVVLGHQLKLDGPVADLDAAGGIDFLDR